MKMANQPKRIILAVDLKAEDVSLTQRIWKAVKPLVKAGTVVEPVTVLNREDAIIGGFLKNQIGSLRQATEKHLAEQLEDLGIHHLATPKVLFADGPSTQRAVLTLLNYAKKTDCDLIAVSSHARQGIKRLFLGSFAETLSLQSPVPLLVVNPKQRRAPSFSNILFPTDFSEESKQGLELVSEVFRNQKAKITLFHTFESPTPFYVEPFSAYPPALSMVEEDLQGKMKLGQAWCVEFRKKGITCDFLMDRKSGFAVSGVLRAIKQKKIGLVAMASHTGKVTAALLGSTTREVLRSAPCPVWVVHPDRRQKQTKVLHLKKRSEDAAPRPRLRVSGGA